MAKEKDAKYHILPDEAMYASDEWLGKCAKDRNCVEMEECARILASRLAKRQAERAARREKLQDSPFDPRTEVSADARHIAGRIVTHLWILFALLPVVAVIMLALVGAIK
jgi:hypothetical protein